MNLQNDEHVTIIHGKNPYIKNDNKKLEIKDKKANTSLSRALDSDEPPFPDKMTSLMANKLMSARNTLGLTRKQLGMSPSVNLSENIIKMYETEGTIINKRELNIIKNFLKVSF